MAQRDYKAYLLRLWRDRVTAPWRGTLENPMTQERQSFASLSELVRYLETETGEVVVGVPNADSSAEGTA